MSLLYHTFIAQVALLIIIVTLTVHAADEVQQVQSTTTEGKLLPGPLPVCYHYIDSDCQAAKVSGEQSKIKHACSMNKVSCQRNMYSDVSKVPRIYCQAAWSFDIENDFNGLLWTSCFPYTDHAPHCANEFCVAEIEKTSRSAKCCCNTPLCNGNFSHTIVTTTIQPADIAAEGMSKATKTALYITVPISITLVIILVIVLIYLRCRQNKLNSKYCESGGGDTALMEDDLSDSVELQPIAVQSQGRFGKVYLGGEIDGIRVAIKTFAPGNKQWWLQEREIYKTPGMKHANITRFIGSRHRGEGPHSEYLIVLEYHPYGSLYDYLKGHNLSWGEMLGVAMSFMRGLSYLHDEQTMIGGATKCSIAHRDIKSKNILIKQDKTAAIADFGLAQKFTTGQMSDSHIQAGTHRYMSPEVLEGAITFSKDSFLRIDVYAAALVLWEILTRCEISENRSSTYKLPFEEEVGLHATLDIMQELVANNKMRPKFPECLKKHEAARRLMDTIDEAWDQDAEARLSASCMESRLVLLYKSSELSAEDGVNCALNNQINSQNITVEEQEVQRLLITSNLPDLHNVLC